MLRGCPSAAPCLQLLVGIVARSISCVRSHIRCLLHALPNSLHTRSNAIRMMLQLHATRYVGACTACALACLSSSSIECPNGIDREQQCLLAMCQPYAAWQGTPGHLQRAGAQSRQGRGMSTCEALPAVACAFWAVPAAMSCADWAVPCAASCAVCAAPEAVRLAAFAASAAFFSDIVRYCSDFSPA